MSKKKKPAETEAASAPRPRHTTADSVRETIESIVIAFVLAFLFRTFEAEAFVIPTGSMAPTLMGRHKDLQCANCGFPYRVSASDEVDPNGRQFADVLLREGKQVVGSICPNCRFPMDYTDEVAVPDVPRSYKGDRILVSKVPFDPEVWNVVVFKYPQGAQQNFIKRVVGVPNTEVMISGGDIYSRPNASDSSEPADFSISRKPPAVAKAMLQMVYDNDYAQPEMIERGWPARWSSENNSWQASDDFRRYRTEGKGAAWLRYRHVTPVSADWDALQKGPLDAQWRQQIRPSLITDFSAYNAGISREGPSFETAELFGLNWVGDLAVECELVVEGNEGQVVFELVEGGHAFQARIDVSDGSVALTCDTLPDYGPSGNSPLKGPGSYHVRLANVDNQLLLWIDEEPVDLGDTGYRLEQAVVPNHRDLSPVGIATDGVSAELSHLKVLRDVYYLSLKGPDISRQYAGHLGSSDWTARAFFSDPLRWPKHIAELPDVYFRLGEDQFLVLGDNSARSKDSRLWADRSEGAMYPGEFYVSRDLLIGRAVYVYWPHSFDRLPGTRIPFPFFPNVERMKLIR